MDDPAQRLCALMDEERQALLVGDLGEVARLVGPKEALLQVVGQAADASGLGLLEAKAHRNRDLLLAAQSGLTAGLKRLEALKTTQNSLSVYTSEGHRRQMPRATGSLLRKA